ncbi:type II toxin-antitoxin system RelE/ParE family toxin [Bartonella sp. AA97HXZ]|uniref:type II toxin-antitoxin system RelE/ParE family toxin n=1 Tax=Bartonella sp. AA97HXZ TaxID=1460972 RepID=UPI0035CF3085
MTRYLNGFNKCYHTRNVKAPAFKMHPLKGELTGYYSIWVNGNWRVTFRFIGTDVELVDYQDYH